MLYHFEGITLPPSYLRGIDDARLDHVDELVVERVVAGAGVLGLGDLVDDDGGVDAGVGGDLPARPAQGRAHDLHAALLVVVRRGDTVGELIFLSLH